MAEATEAQVRGQRWCVLRMDLGPYVDVDDAYCVQAGGTILIMTRMLVP